MPIARGLLRTLGFFSLSCNRCSGRWEMALPGGKVPRGGLRTFLGDVLCIVCKRSISKMFSFLDVHDRFHKAHVA